MEFDLAKTASYNRSGMQKLNQEIPKQTTEKAKMSDVKCQIIILARFHWRKHEQTRFRSITFVYPQALSRESASGNMRFLTETYRKVVRFRRIRSRGNMNKRHVSATGNTC